MAALGPVINMYQNLVREWTAKPINLANVGVLLTKLKVSSFIFIFIVIKKVIKLQFFHGEMCQSKQAKK